MNWTDRVVPPDLIDIACGLPMVQKQRRQLVPQAQSCALDAGVSRLQERLQPLWGPQTGGCQLERDQPALVQEAGFAAHTQSAYLAGPRPMTFHYWGQAQSV